jgi:MFS family permease
MAGTEQNGKIFYGWWVVAASFVTLGIAVGLPYFGMTFFYDYFERPVVEGGLGWTRTAITLGLPLGTLSTLWVGPVLVHRFAPRKLILIGTGLTMLVFIGFSRMTGGPEVFYGLYFFYMVANNLSGGVTHQIILSRWFVRQRGLAISIGYLGTSIIGAISIPLVAEPLTRAYGYRHALLIIGLLLLVTWPLVQFVLRDDPRQMGLLPDGESRPFGEASVPSVAGATFREILGRRVIWILLAGGVCLAGAVGSINLLLKLILKDRGATSQVALDQTFSQTLSLILLVSAVARILVGRLSDRIPKRHMLTMTWLPLMAGIPLLASVPPATVPVLFCLLYGVALGADYLLLVVTAAEIYDVATIPKVLAILIPVMTVGQSWTPYGVSLIREESGSYTIPLAVIFVMALLGRLVLTLLPFPAGWQREAATGK